MRSAIDNSPVEATDKDSFDQAILLICIMTPFTIATFRNVATLHLDQEFLRVHSGIPVRRTRSVNRGSLRIASHTGSSL